MSTTTKEPLITLAEFDALPRVSMDPEAFARVRAALEALPKVQSAGVAITQALCTLPPALRLMVLAEAARILGK